VYYECASLNDLLLSGCCVEEVDCFLVAVGVYHVYSLFCEGEHGAPDAGWLDFAEAVDYGQVAFD